MGFTRKGDRETNDDLREGILGVSFHQLEDILQLPRGYRIRAIYPDPYNRGVQILLSSPDLPVVPEGHFPPRLPEVDVSVTTRKFRDPQDRNREDFWHRTTVAWHRQDEGDVEEEEERA